MTGSVGGSNRRHRALAAAALLLLVVAGSLGWLPRASGGPPSVCRNETATIVGTPEPDGLHGTAGPDVIFGGAGDDVIGGAGGSDLICGGQGADVLSGGTGGDGMFGGPGADLMHGNRGNDRVSGGADGADIAYGDLGDDWVRGGAGDGDEAAGGLGIDIANGGPGDGDLVSGDYGWDVMIGGAGAGDVASFATELPDRFGTGIHASLVTGRADGDGRDVLRGFEDLKGSAFADVLIGDHADNLIDGGPGDDLLAGGGGHDSARGDQGDDQCRGFAVRASCGASKGFGAPLYVKADVSPAGGGDLDVLPVAAGDDRVRVSFNGRAGVFSLTSRRPVAVGQGCKRVAGRTKISCAVDGPARSLVVDLGSGDDRLLLAGALRAIGQIRATGGPGDDELIGGAGDELFESGAGSDLLRGAGGSDGLIGGFPGADVLVGGRGGDLLSAGGACVGGALIGGPGRDNASFAETPAHPGVLYASLAAGLAKVDAIEGCRPVRLDHSDEDLEGSYDWDILVGDGGGNVLFGQPGQDRLFGRGGDDVVAAQDGERDFRISCGAGRDTLLSDPSDPPGSSC